MTEPEKQISTRSIKKEKDLLKDRFIEFQIEIAGLSKTVAEQEDAFERRQRELFVDIFDVLDAFENLKNAYGEKADTLDKTARRILKGARSIDLKLQRILKARKIVPIEFPDGKATIAHCRIVDTKPIPDAENERIISIEKRGYIDETRNLVLRKAEVVTVSNTEGN